MRCSQGDIFRAACMTNPATPALAHCQTKTVAVAAWCLHKKHPGDALGRAKGRLQSR